MAPILQALLASAVISVAWCAPVADNHVLHEKRDGSLSTWIKRDRLEPHAVIPVKIGLKQENLDLGEEWLMQVSDPDSPQYSSHWTAAKVHEAFAPHDDTIAAIREWLHAAGFTGDRVKQSENKGWLSFDATAAEAESLFKTELHEHEHVDNGKWAVGCDEYHLPAHIQPHVDYITPGVKIAELRKRTVSRNGREPFKTAVAPIIEHQTTARVSSTDLSICDQLITPACIAALYGIPETSHTATNSGNSFGIFEQGQSYAQTDLNYFFGNLSSWIPKGTHPKLASIDGGQGPASVVNAGGEADLDFQVAYPIVYPQQITIYQVDDNNYSEGSEGRSGFANTFLDALDGSYCSYKAYGETGNDADLDPMYPDPGAGGYKGGLMCGRYTPANVISISYGQQEVNLPAAYQQRQCNEFMKLGLQGVSVFMASGDSGVAGGASYSNPNGCLGSKDKIFNPTSPNSCPYVTNVGATMVPYGNTVTQPETAALGQFSSGTFSSGGGFSNIYGIPAYQKTAVATYFAKHNPSYAHYSMTGGFDASKAGNGIYNRIGHGIPDISANGLNLAIYNQGELYSFGGTSASTPIVAGIVTRINSARLNQGKKPVGFINPALYKNPSMLNDITSGTNPGCGTAGFSAVTGWDPVTGLGTPNYTKMLAYFTKLA